MEENKILFIRTVSKYLVVHFNFYQEVADFIGCQFALESCFGTSRLAVEDSNYCGMKRSLVRISSRLRGGSFESKTFSVYLSLEDCIIDFVLLLQYRRPLSTNIDTIKHYCAFIQGWYCPEKDYIDKIQSIYSQFKNSQNGN